MQGREILEALAGIEINADRCDSAIDRSVSRAGSRAEYS